MKQNKFWAAVLTFWTLLLAVWTMFCWSSWKAQAAEAAVIGPGKAAQKLADWQGGVLDVPFLDQREGFPTGCESVCAVMALQYFGADISPDSFVDRYLPLGEAPHWNEAGEYVGCDPRRAFPGDPRTEEGWGCYAPVIQKALEDFLSTRPELGLSAKELDGLSLDELWEDFSARGIPVLVWATIDMAEPFCSTSFRIEDTGEDFSWIYPMHCLVLTGKEGENFLFNDPLAGKDMAYPREAAVRAYEGLGRQAVALLPE